MKSKLHLQSLAAIFFLIVSLGTAPAQKGPGAPPAVDTNAGLPITMPQPGSAGGLGRPFGNRSGWAWNARSRTACRAW